MKRISLAQPQLNKLVEKNLPESVGMMVYGKPIEELSKDELKAVIVELSKRFKPKPKAEVKVCKPMDD